MNIDEAIKAHSDWRVRLRSYMRGRSQEKLDASVVSKDNLCALGKWIYGEGKRFQHEPAFGELVKEHAEFHKAAGHIIQLIDRKQLEQAEQELDAPGATYARASMHVTAALMKIKGIL